MKNKGVRQYSAKCKDTDNNSFYAFTKATDKAHARGIFLDRIRRKVSTHLKAALGEGKTMYKLIIGSIRQSEWTAKSK